MSKVLCCAYGTLRTGCSNFRVMRNADGVSIGLGKLKECANMVSLGGFPAVSLKHTDMGIHPVVEVFEVPANHVRILDRLEGTNPEKPVDKNNLYNRQEVDVIMDDGQEVRAWIYYINSDFVGHTKIESGDWIEFRNQD